MDRIKSWVKNGVVKTENLVKKFPIASFVVMLVTLFLLIGLSYVLNRPISDESEEVVNPKSVEVYRIGAPAYMEAVASVEKAGVVTITAQASGIVQRINVNTGSQVDKGTQLVNLSQTWSGSNAATIARQIQSVTNKNFNDTYDTQVEVINRQREIATQNQDNAAAQRELSERAFYDAQVGLNLNLEIMDQLQKNLDQLEASNSGGMNDQAIFGIKQQKSQYTSAINGIKAQMDSARYQYEDDNPPANLANEQYALTLKNLELQQKSLEMTKQLNSLQLQLARVQEAAYFPTAPFSGIVEQIHVLPGDQVSPGDALITVSNAENQPIKLTAYVNQQVAAGVSQSMPTELVVNGQIVNVYPTFVSTAPTRGQLYAVTYYLGSEYENVLAEQSGVKNEQTESKSGGETGLRQAQAGKQEATSSFYTTSGHAGSLVTNTIIGNLRPDQSVTLRIPFGQADTGSTVPMIPIDAVFQTTAENVVFVDEAGVAASRQVQLGNVYGAYVEVLGGLQNGDQVILDRSVIAGDAVVVK